MEAMTYIYHPYLVSLSFYTIPIMPLFLNSQDFLFTCNYIYFSDILVGNPKCRPHWMFSLDFRSRFLPAELTQSCHALWLFSVFESGNCSKHDFVMKPILSVSSCLLPYFPDTLRVQRSSTVKSSLARFVA